MLLGRRVVAAAISLVILAAPWVLGLGVLLWTFAATDSRWMAFATSVLLAWIAYMAIQLPFIFWWGRITSRTGDHVSSGAPSDERMKARRSHGE